MKQKQMKYKQMKQTINNRKKMKKIVLSLMTAALLLAGCGSGEKKVPFEEVNIDQIVRDTTIYGFCGKEVAENVLQLITDNGDTLLINIGAAKNRHQIFGGYNVGDEMAVVPNTDSTAAVMIINKSTLLGNWVMPNPIDGSSETGISLLKGGTAESIDQSSIVYKSWRLFNGQLQIQATRDDGIDMEDILYFKIKALTPDSLVLEDDENDLHEYSRPTPEEEDDLGGVELDWGDDADYRI